MRKKMRKLRSFVLAVAIAAISACSSTEGADCGTEFGPIIKIGDDFEIGDIYEMPDLDIIVGDTVGTSLLDYYAPPRLCEALC